MQNHIRIEETEPGGVRTGGSPVAGIGGAEAWLIGDAHHLDGGMVMLDPVAAPLGTRVIHHHAGATRLSDCRHQRLLQMR
jgi:hypothetical protein